MNVEWVWAGCVGKCLCSWCDGDAIQVNYEGEDGCGVVLWARILCACEGEVELWVWSGLCSCL